MVDARTSEWSDGRPGGLRLRIPDSHPPRVEMLDADRWAPAPRRALARRYAVGEGPWPWLLAHGIRRPSPSGPSGRTQSDESRRAAGLVRLTVRLTAEEHAALERLRHGRSVRDTIGELLLDRDPETQVSQASDDLALDDGYELLSDHDEDWTG